MNDYPWYELIDGKDEITQGDILKGCPVPILKGYTGDANEVEAEIIIIDGIIMTQACDIENNKVENIILCGITSKDDFEQIMHENGKSSAKIKSHIDGIIKGQQNAFHIINNYKTEEFSQDYYIINLNP